MTNENELCLKINTDGTLIFLVNDKIQEFAKLGNVTTKRASHVEPHNYIFRMLFHIIRYFFGDKGKISQFTRYWPCLWRVNLSPVGGPILAQKWEDRQSAINAEIKWLNENFL